MTMKRLTPLRRVTLDFARPFALYALGAFVALITTAAAHASVIIGPSSLLSQTDADKLEGWLGEGPIAVTRIFAKTNGATSFDFHAAADGQGRTFTVIEVLANTAYDGYTSAPTNNPAQVIGGYNPQSWHSSYDYNYTPNDVDRTAFLFNLTTDEIQRQNLTTEGYVSSGTYQTYNGADFGPSFGGGFDIYVSTYMTFGYVNPFSYGGTSYTDNILGGTSPYYSIGNMFGAIEVFTIAAAPVSAEAPEPLSVLVWGSLIACGAAVRVRLRAA